MGPRTAQENEISGYRLPGRSLGRYQWVPRFSCQLSRSYGMDPAMISSALRNGDPLPQITPCPLLDRFTLQYQGLDVIHKEAEEDYGLPRTLTLDTLQNEQYL